MKLKQTLIGLTWRDKPSPGLWDSAANTATFTFCCGNVDTKMGKLESLDIKSIGWEIVDVWFCQCVSALVIVLTGDILFSRWTTWTKRLWTVCVHRAWLAAELSSALLIVDKNEHGDPECNIGQCSQLLRIQINQQSQKALIYNFDNNRECPYKVFHRSIWALSEKDSKDWNVCGWRSFAFVPNWLYWLLERFHCCYWETWTSATRVFTGRRFTRQMPYLAYSSFTHTHWIKLSDEREGHKLYQLN